MQASILLTMGMGVAGQPDYTAMWKQFKNDYGKWYNDDEQNRFQVFKSNIDIIEKTNAQGLTYTLGINEFADLTWNEFAETHLGYSRTSKFQGLPLLPSLHGSDAPDSIDWVDKGGVTPVKDQKTCGSCWAFASTGAMEGAYFIASSKLQSLSEQQLVSCDHSDDACQGGTMDSAFTWAEGEGGLCTEGDYPYKAAKGECKNFNKCKPAVTIAGYTDVTAKDEAALKVAVANQPVAVAIEADKTVFQHYKSGVFDSPSCGSTLDHAVLVVGYGMQNGTSYWKVKNSWGASWGMDGYILLARGKNMCGVAEQPSYPTGARAAGPAPGPAPPGPKQSHYGKPPCRSDEVEASIQGAGVLCAPQCDGLDTSCPMDTPPPFAAKPRCMLEDRTAHKHYCALECHTMIPMVACPAGEACVRVGSGPSAPNMCVWRTGDATSPTMLELARNSTIAV